MTTTTTTTTNAPGWAFVLGHSALIDRLAWKHVLGTSLEFEDYRAEVITRLVTIHDAFDPTRGSAVNWIWMACLRVRRTMVRAAVRGAAAPMLGGLAGEGGEALHADEDRALADHRPAARALARADLDVLLSRATSQEYTAALSVLRGWDAAQVRARLGVSLAARDAIVSGIYRYTHRQFDNHQEAT